MERSAARAERLFRQAFGSRPSVVASAPGRVNFIGEHTDYNGGLVLPLALHQRTTVAAGPDGGHRAKVTTELTGETVEIDLQAPVRPGEPAWANHVRGVVAGAIASGEKVPGFRAAIASDVPAGSGLSSSAALNVAFVTLLEALGAVKLPPLEKARLAQWSEHRFAGVPCGLMDQAISVLARAGCLLQLDCRDDSHRHVPWPDDSWQLVVTDSGVRHDLAAGAYARRRAECESAARALGVATLRDATPAQAESLDHPTVRRRARHVVSEIRRVQACGAALEARDWVTVGRLMLESHASLRDDFEVSCAELDECVALALSHGALGARMTGGGFGGCVVALAPADAVGGLLDRCRASGRAAFVTLPSAGAEWREG